jgi:hypothetical protein
MNHCISLSSKNPPQTLLFLESPNLRPSKVSICAPYSTPTPLGPKWALSKLFDCCLLTSRFVSFYRGMQGNMRVYVWYLFIYLIFFGETIHVPHWHMQYDHSSAYVPELQQRYRGALLALFFGEQRLRAAPPVFLCLLYLQCTVQTCVSAVQSYGASSRLCLGRSRCWGMNPYHTPLSSACWERKWKGFYTQVALHELHSGNGYK